MKLGFGILLSCLTIFLTVSCGGGESSGKKMTSEGFEYMYYHDEPGDRGNIGDVVYFDFDILDHEGNVIQSYREGASEPNIQILAADDPGIKNNPLFALLRECSVGDSIGMIIPMDSMPNRPPEFAEFPHFEYRLQINEILSEEESKARVAEERKKLEEAAALVKVRETEVASFVAGIVDQYNSGALNSKMKDGPDGLRYIIHEEGEGPNAENNQQATVLYYGVVKDGTMFDNAFMRGRGYTFGVGQGSVIKGWDLGIPLLNKGAKATLFIPSELGYGERGSPPKIAPNSELIFYVELEDIK